jgi:hypothetical protein
MYWLGEPPPNISNCRSTPNSYGVLVGGVCKPLKENPSNLERGTSCFVWSEVGESGYEGFINSQGMCELPEAKEAEKRRAETGLEEMKKAEKEDNTVLYLSIAGGAIVGGALLYWLTRKAE